MSEIALEVGSRRLTGFSTLRIATSLVGAAATASFGGSSFAARTFNGFEDVRATVDGQVVFTGALDRIEQELTDSGSSFRATARSRTADLLDSTVDPELVPGEILDRDVVSIIQTYQRALEPITSGTGALQIPAPRSSQLVRPLERIAKHAPASGESYWSAIERACRQVGVIATASRFGGLELISATRFPAVAAALREGDNVLSARSSTDWAERAHTVVAQGEGDAFGDGWETRLSVRGTAVDAAVRPTRTQLVRVEGSPTPDECAARAQWEAQVRAARGTKVSVVTPGWLIPGTSAPWTPGTRVPVALPSLRVAGRLLIDSVALRFGEGGITTQLDLVREDAYRRAPEIAAEEEPTWDSVGGGA